MVHEIVALAHRGEQVWLALVSREGLERHRRPRLLAQLLQALDPVDLPQVGQIEHALDVDHLAFLDLQLLDQELPQILVHVGAYLEPHDLSKAPLAQFLLHRLQQVVALVGDREVGVAGHAEVGVSQHLHAGEERAEVARDDRLQRHEGVVPDLHEARQHLFWHLHARKQLGLGDGIAQPHGKAQGEIGYVRERPARPHRQRRERREDLLVEDAVDLVELLGGGLRALLYPDAVVCQARPQHLLPLVGLAPAQIASAIR